MHEEDEPRPTEEQLARRERIRRWYDEAMAMGISEEDFIREMTPVVGDEELDKALYGDDGSESVPLWRP
jgi:hypothetical protein